MSLEACINHGLSIHNDSFNFYMNFEVCILKYESCICISFPPWNLKYEKLKRLKREKKNVEISIFMLTL